MHFCEKCENMYYISVSPETNILIYYCRHCGHKNDKISMDNICVSKLNIKRTEQKFNHLINQYTKLDPTLPRVNNIACPNDNCPTKENTSLGNDVIFMRYDDANLKYVYICTHCDHNWTL